MSSLSTVFQANINEAIATLRSLSALHDPLDRAAQLVGNCLLQGNKLITCGNGGSAADASHFATEFVSRFDREREPFAAIALNDFGSTLTAIGNDYAFDQVFARQLRAFGRRGDVLVAFSTSGRSPNVVRALAAAAGIGMPSIAFLGKGGGAAKGLATVEMLVPHETTARIQEAHLLLYHSLCESVEAILASNVPLQAS